MVERAGLNLLFCLKIDFKLSRIVSVGKVCEKIGCYALKSKTIYIEDIDIQERGRQGKRVVEMHEGKVWVEDNPEGGSIFYVSLPKERVVG
jgi:hypothetical protein